MQPAMRPDRVEEAKQRRLKEPLEITGYNVEISKVHIIRPESAPQASRTTQTFVVRHILTIGDLAKMDAHVKLGKFIPVPDLSLQALMIVIDKLGLLEDKVQEGGSKKNKGRQKRGKKNDGKA